MTARHERSQLEVSRLDRAGTLLLASLSLAVVVRLGWGGPLIDLRLPGDVAGRVFAALRDGLPVGPVVLSLVGEVRPADLLPLVGTVVTIALIWHVLSLVTEVLLVIAETLGWLRSRWMMPVWRLLDLVDSAPLARPKRFVVAGALAGQLVVRSAVPVGAAPLQVPETASVAQRVGSPAGVDRTTAQTEDEPAAATAPWLVHHVRWGETLSGLGVRYYGDPGHWVTLFRGNAGTVMGWADGGRGAPIRLTNPDYILAGCDLSVPPVPGRLEQGPNGEVIYVVQRGDTLSGIADRFDVNLDDLWATNGGAQGPDGRVVDDPDTIWPGVRIQVSHLRVASSEPDLEPQPEPLGLEAAPPVEIAAVQPTPTPVIAIPVVQPSPSTTSTLGPPTVTPAASEPPVAAAAPVSAPAERSANPTPPVWPVAPLVIGGALVAGALVARRQRRRPFETDLAFAGGRVSAKPAESLHARSPGDPGDPAELVAAALLRLAASHVVAEVQVVAVFRDPKEITVTLSAPAVERDRLRLLLTAAAAPLARRVTVWQTVDHDVAVRLEDPRASELTAVEGGLPLLLSIGGLGDGRELLADWQTMGHLLVASRSGTDDACVQLTATVTMLAACQPADRLRFYTCAGRGSALEPLSALPHQQVVARTPDAVSEVLAALERSLDTRGESAIERVLIVGELGELAAEARRSLERLLALGLTRGLRVLAAVTDLALASRLAAEFATRIVYSLGDEDSSVRLLGSTDAASLPVDGSMLVRLAGRTELIEAYQLRVLDEDLAALLETMRAAGQSRSVESQRRPQQESPVGGEVDRAEPPAIPSIRKDAVEGPVVAHASTRLSAASTPNGQADAARPADDQDETTVGPDEVPAHVAVLLTRTEPGQPVLQCLGGLALWSQDRLGRVRLIGPGTGPRQLRLTRQFELLTYVAVRTATLGAGADHRGGSVPEIEARADLWSDAASKQIVGITARRLMLELNRVGLELRVSPLRAEHGTVLLDEGGCLVDVVAFEQAVRAARGARGAPGLPAAEAAVAAYGGRLLDGVGPEVEEEGGRQPTARGGRPTRAPLLGWTQELATLSVASKVEALYREALGLLAARLKEDGRVEEALDRAWAALRASDIVPPDDARRLGRLVVEAAVGVPDQARARDSYKRLAEYFEDNGLDVPDYLKEHLLPAGADLNSSPGKRVAVAAE